MANSTISGNIDLLFGRLYLVTTPDMAAKIVALLADRMGKRLVAVGRIPPPSPGGRPLDKLYVDDKGNPSAFKSDKQRRYVFWALSQGLIPSQRTGTLINSLSYAVETTTTSGAVVHYGTNTPYAPYVIGDKQNRYHAKTGWQVLDDQVTSQTPALQAGLMTDLTSVLTQVIQGTFTL